VLALATHTGGLCMSKGHRAQAPAHVDAYGDGEALASVRAKAEAAGLALTFHAKRDHLDASLADYQVGPPQPGTQSPGQEEVVLHRQGLDC